MLIARTLDDLAAARAVLRAQHKALALVPTMGALHEGHVSLLHAARQVAPAVAASIFVNPTQFAPHEDFSRYPRDEAGDLACLAAAGCDLVWLPEAAVMYPPGDASAVEVGGPALGWEGAVRPGHFRGVATVVTKLFGQVKPDAALFGEKDWQQLQVISRMAADLCLPVNVVGAPIVRESDGLAMSSRNRFLSESERDIAPLLHGVLVDVRNAMARGAAATASLTEGRARLAAGGLAVDYLALVDGASLIETTLAGAAARLIAAARLGNVRLLDNIAAA